MRSLEAISLGAKLSFRSKQEIPSQVVAGDVFHPHNPLDGVISVGLCARFQVHCEETLGLVFSSEVDEFDPGIDGCVSWDARRAPHGSECQLKVQNNLFHGIAYFTNKSLNLTSGAIRNSASSSLSIDLTAASNPGMKRPSSS